MFNSKIDAQGRVELPNEVLKYYRLAPGDDVKFRIDNVGNVVLLPGGDIRDLRGSLKSNGIHLTIEQINEIIESKR